MKTHFLHVDKESGFTLIEVMIAVSILALMSLAMFVATSQTLKSQQMTEDRDEINHAVTQAFRRISEDLNMALILRSKSLLGDDFDSEYAFVGEEERVDFVSFSHLRILADAKESEVAEISYYLLPMPEASNKWILMRRESPQVDKNLQEGGVAYPLLENIDAFRLEYLDAKSSEFKTNWNSTSIDFSNRLPQAVRIQIEWTFPDEEERRVLTSLAPIRMQGPISF